MRASEFLTWGVLIGAAIWGASVALASPLDKPVASCRPLVWVAGAVREGLRAVKPGSAFESAGAKLQEETARMCLSYAANLFQVNPPQAVANH
jgi:hypothetical protein